VLETQAAYDRLGVQASRLDESKWQFSSAEKETPIRRNTARMMYTATRLQLP
jgi:hypothetical protein